jgi:predicted CXXCH cytochrome family protein
MRTVLHLGAGQVAKARHFLPFVVVGLCVVLVLSGCSSTARHKWLTIFFDDVPALNAGTNDVATSPVSGRAKQLVTPPAYSVHKPYFDGNCFACHKSASDVSMRAPLKQVCLVCHKTLLPVAAKSTHVPVDNGDCLECHNPHHSFNKFLLVRTGKALCAYCHDPDIAKPVSSHEPFEDGDCLSCHDAHASAHKDLLLRTGTKLCFGCHDDFLAKAKFKHDPVENGDCDLCHNPHAANHKNLLIKESSKLCEDCHDPHDIAADKGHVNMGNASCIECHDPHIGNTEYLLKPGKTVAKAPLP